MKVVLDVKKLHNVDEAHAYLKEQLELPDYYGNNLDALHDCLTEYADLDVTFENQEEAEGYALKIMKVFEDALSEANSKEVVKMAVCKSCGQEVREGAKFCENCGAPIEAEAEVTMEAEVEPEVEAVEGEVVNEESQSDSYTNPDPQPRKEFNENTDSVPGKNEAIGALIAGGIGVLCWFFGVSAILSVAGGIVGLILASKSKKMGYNENIRLIGFILSIVALIIGALIFIITCACIGTIGCAGMAGLLGELR